MGDGLPAFTNSTRTLWEMGNVLVSALDDVYYFKDLWGSTMDTQPSWQYAYINGPGGWLRNHWQGSRSCCECTCVQLHAPKALCRALALVC
jgi:hypothetical protein